jgi:hypothetical protein
MKVLKISEIVQRYYETNTGCNVQMNNNNCVITVFFLLSEFEKIKNMPGLTFEFFSKGYDYSLENETLEMTLLLETSSIDEFIEYWELMYILSDKKLKFVQEFNANVGKR